MKYKIFQRIIKNILQHLEMSYEEMFDKSNKPDSVRNAPITPTAVHRVRAMEPVK